MTTTLRMFHGYGSVEQELQHNRLQNLDLPNYSEEHARFKL